MKLCAIVGAAALCAMVSISGANAGVVTFTGLPEETMDLFVWSEVGITATAIGGYFGSWVTPDSAHIDDPGSTGFAYAISFSMGQRFTATSFDLIPIDPFPPNFCDESDHPNCASYSNIRVAGFRDSALVAEDLFNMGVSPTTYLFNSDFWNLDSVLIAAILPTDTIPDLGNVTCPPCAHFNIDNVTLHPVPVPAALPLFLAALGGLGLLHRLKRAMPPGLRW